MTRREKVDRPAALRRARRARDVRVILALALGDSVREVAAAFGLSPARVCQIRAEAARNKN